jgi:N-acetyl-gamma-glutamyl-phosphate reductase
LLPLIPLLRARLVKPDGIIAASLSGVSGAGRKLENDYLFVECHESARAYAVLRHRHLSEIEEQLSAAAETAVLIQFTPHLIPVNRGIVTTLYLTPEKPFAGDREMESLEGQIAGCFQAAYADEPFVRLLDSQRLPDTKNVTGSNVIEIAWRLDPRTGRLLVLSALDNLIKGASGQAVQSMNILCGFPETAGLA